MLPVAAERWEYIAINRRFDLIDDLLADDVVFHSPIVHTPQAGRAIVKNYLIAAVHVMGGPKANFIGRWDADDSAVLELQTEVNGLIINAIDIIGWNSEGCINYFKVMVRPLKAMNTIHEVMSGVLAAAYSIR